jgi:HK97 family phage prohead protease
LELDKKVVHKTVSKETKGTDFILSDPTVDRYGDIILSDGWELKNFKQNPIALFAHRSDFPIGKWQNLRVSDNALRGTLELAPKGTSDRIDEIHRLVDADILRAVSVGFTPIQSKPRPGDEFGTIYIRQELVECSIVTVPANPSALNVAKRLNISAETQELVFGSQAVNKYYTSVQVNELIKELIDGNIEVMSRSFDSWADGLRKEWHKELRQEITDLKKEIEISELKKEIAILKRGKR